MTEKTIVLEAIDPLDLFGVNDEKISLIKSYFPSLKIVARGDKIKAIGKKEDISVFNQKMSLLIRYYSSYNQLTKSNIETILSDGFKPVKKETNVDDCVLVYGPSGNLIKAKTANQRKLANSFAKNDVIWRNLTEGLCVHCSAGTGCLTLNEKSQSVKHLSPCALRSQ